MVTATARLHSIARIRTPRARISAHLSRVKLSPTMATSTCTYLLPAGGTTCTKPYTNTNSSDTCTYTLPCSTVTGHTPTIQGTVCKYTPNAGEQCATGYGLVNGQCISNANTNSLNSSPPNVCPPKYKPNNFGQCSLPGSYGPAGTIDATCQTGYFSYSSSCVPNSDAYLIDPTTGPCTLNTVLTLPIFLRPIILARTGTEECC